MDIQTPSIPTSEESGLVLTKKHLLTVGVILAFIGAPIPGLVYGLPLAIKKDRDMRSVGLIVVGLTIFWTVVNVFLAQSGYGALIFNSLFTY